jgi:hypothetical protein
MMEVPRRTCIRVQVPIVPNIEIGKRAMNMDANFLAGFRSTEYPNHRDLRLVKFLSISNFVRQRRVEFRRVCLIMVHTV